MNEFKMLDAAASMLIEAMDEAKFLQARYDEAIRKVAKAEKALSVGRRPTSPEKRKTRLDHYVKRKMCLDHYVSWRNLMDRLSGEHSFGDHAKLVMECFRKRLADNKELVNHDYSMPMVATDGANESAPENPPRSVRKRKTSRKK